MNSELIVVLEPGVAQKLQFAINRTGGTLEDVEYLSTGDNFRAVSLLRKGQAKLVDVFEDVSERHCLQPTPTPARWTTDGNGVIYVTVTSNGMTGEEWITHFDTSGFRLSDYARYMLYNVSEAPTTGVIYEVLVFRAEKITSHDRVTYKIHALATARGWKTPHWEVACLLRDTFSDEDLAKMGLFWIVTMHKPIFNSDGDPHLLSLHFYNTCRLLDTHNGSLESRFFDSGGFAFVL